MKVSIIGTGYVGLVTGVCLADKGHDVVCVDVDQDKIEKISQGIPTIYERGLEDLLRKNVGSTLRATTDLSNAVIGTDVTFIAVGTPFDGNEIDLAYVKEASRQIGAALGQKSSYHLVVVKSTVVPGTTDEVVLPILEKASGKEAGVDFGVGMNPEFLREGEAIQDFLYPDRIVLGGNDQESRDRLEEVYAQFDTAERVKTNNKTAEMIKYSANCLFATLISFSNEIGNLCAGIGGIDVTDVMKGVHLDKRLSPFLPDGERIQPGFTTYLEAGCGFGGSCFPKDLQALISHGKNAGQTMQLLDAVNRVNQKQPQQVLAILRRHVSPLKGVEIAVLGLAFKPDTDDMRESPAIPVINGLLSEKAAIRAYDPIASREAKKIFRNRDIVFCDTLAEAIEDARVIIVLTRWEEFRTIPDLIREFRTQPLVIDGRRMLEKRSIERYAGIGL